VNIVLLRADRTYFEIVAVPVDVFEHQSLSGFEGCDSATRHGRRAVTADHEWSDEERYLVNKLGVVERTVDGRAALNKERRHLSPGKVIEDGAEVYATVVAGPELDQLDSSLAQASPVFSGRLDGVIDQGRSGLFPDDHRLARRTESRVEDDPPPSRNGVESETSSQPGVVAAAFIVTHGR
jgi:hypothetical protein